MQLKVLTFNVLFNRALPGLAHIVAETKPDIICLQEIETDQKSLNKYQPKDYLLADYSNCFIKFGKIFGLATYYRTSTLSLVRSESLNLPRSFIEAFLVVLKGGNNPRTFLKTIFNIKDGSRKLVIYNIHLTALGSNGARLKQLKETLEDVHEDTSLKHPTIIAGDLNYYPLRRKKLENIMEAYGLREATAGITYTFDKDRYQDDFLHTFILKLTPWSSHTKTDYILYRNLNFKQVKRLDVELSDHFPIVASFEAV